MPKPKVAINEILDALFDGACKALHDRGDARTLQHAMAKRFAEPNPPLYRPINPKILPEVSRRIPESSRAGMTTTSMATYAPPSMPPRPTPAPTSRNLERNTDFLLSFPRR